MNLQFPFWYSKGCQELWIISFLVTLIYLFENLNEIASEATLPSLATFLITISFSYASFYHPGLTQPNEIQVLSVSVTSTGFGAIR